MLEVNPKYTDPSYDDDLNVIDARWIDIETGLFIDITAVRPHLTKKGIMCSKDQHEEKVSSSPLSLRSSSVPAISPTQIADKLPSGRGSLPPARLLFRRPTGQDSLQLRQPAHAGIRQLGPHKDHVLGPPLQLDEYGVGAVTVSELPGENGLPGLAGPAARWEEETDEVYGLTYRQGPSR